MSYIRYLLGTLVVTLSAVGFLNFFVDPAGIYREAGISPKEYASRLIDSKIGLFVPDDAFDERLVTKELASFAKRFDCVVIGSSHVMQLSSSREPKSLTELCSSILNLGVSAGTLEDHIALSLISVQQGKPRKIILGVDPWTLAFGKDKGWLSYKDEYYRASTLILDSGESRVETGGSLLTVKAKNLLNLEYTIRSIQVLRRRLTNGPPRISEVESVDLNIGGKEPIRLNDGSVVYSAKYISESRNKEIPLGGSVYKTDGVLNQIEAIQAYRKLLVWLQRNGVQPVLLLTPYHENVWKNENSLNVRAMKATELIVRNIATDLEIPLVGSYDPSKVGCAGSEFYDFMHPSSNCVARLRQASH